MSIQDHASRAERYAATLRAGLGTANAPTQHETIMADLADSVAVLFHALAPDPPASAPEPPAQLEPQENQ